MLLVVGAAAVAAAAVAIGGAVVGAREGGGAAHEATNPIAEAGRPRPGVPPLSLDLGVRDDAEARALRRAERLYEQGRRAAAARIFARHDSVDARVGLALGRWPTGSVVALRDLARDHPGDDAVRLHHGFALFWSGQEQAAVREWRAATEPEVDSASGLRAEDLLFPNFPQGRPTFVPPGPQPALTGLAPPQQLERLRRDARRGGVDARLAYGAALQRLGVPLAARAQYDRAVTEAPGELAPRVAAAVARFTKERPEAAFARIGPLARRHPRSPVVQFHVALLLLWLGDVDAARDRLERVRSAAPESRLGVEANRFLVRLESVRTEPPKR